MHYKFHLNSDVQDVLPGFPMQPHKVLALTGASCCPTKSQLRKNWKVDYVGHIITETDTEVNNEFKI